MPAKPDSNGNLAAHQAETLREVAEERAGEEMLSPRASWAPQKDTGDLSQYAEDPGMDDMATNSKNQREDALAAAQNGGSIRDADDRDADSDHGDDDMDDDMMDKISSSPSIEDGGFSLRQAWPARSDSLHSHLYPRLSFSSEHGQTEVSSEHVQCGPANSSSLDVSHTPG